VIFKEKKGLIMRNYHNPNSDIILILASYGNNPVRIHCNSAWYKSPFRDETVASFKVDIGKNVWYDYGLGEGGNSIKLISMLKQISTKEAYRTLTNSIFPKIDLKVNPVENCPLKILKASNPIKHPALINYLLSRRIDLSMANLCKPLKEVNYQIRDKSFFALGFENDKGGFEIRSPVWKGASSPKSISTIVGKSKDLNVFEGFMDYLSALTYYQMNCSVHTSIILNGTGQVQQLIPLLSQYAKVYLFVDNDNAGNKVVELIMQKDPNAVNVSLQLYPNYKDFNEFLSQGNKTFLGKN